MGDLSEHFSRSEFECHCGKCELPENYPRPEFIQALEDLRALIAAKYGEHSIKIISGYRDPEHNKKIGGAPHSRHLYGDAADIMVDGLTPDQVMEIAEEVGPIKCACGAVVAGFGGLGIGFTKLHVDGRPRKTDGTRALWTYQNKPYTWQVE